MKSTMQDAPLLISNILRHGEFVYADKRIFTVTPEGVEEATFFEVSKRAEQLAAALERLGVQRGDRVATFMWNNQAHVEAYYAVPGMGAVLHTLNIRLFPEQLVYIINHAEDRIIIVDASLAAVFAKVRDQISPANHDCRPRPRAHRGARRNAGLRNPGQLRASGLRVARTRRARWRPSCATRRAPPATPRASSTRTARPGCTRWPSRRRTRSACASATAASSSSRCSTSTPGGPCTPRSSRGSS